MDGCLGDGSYGVRFVTRPTAAGPRRSLGEATVVSGSWNRKLNALSDASAQFSLASDEPGCADLLAGLRPWRDEMELYRSQSDGAEGDLVWAGPVIDVAANPDTQAATVTARDLSAWWAKRVLAADMVSRALDLSTIFENYIAAAFAVDDPGIVVSATPTGIIGDRTIAASDRTRLDVALAELSRTGVDWTVAIRQFIVGGSEIATVGVLPGRWVDEHFRAAPQTRRSGADQVNHTTVRGSGVIGTAGGPDPDDGVLLADVMDEASIEDVPSATAAAQTWRDRVAEPLVYLEGSNVLAASAPVAVEQLIPGVLVPVDVAGGGVVPLLQLLRLESVTTTFDADGEAITVALQPPGTTDG